MAITFAIFDYDWELNCKFLKINEESINVRDVTAVKIGLKQPAIHQPTC